MARSRGWNTDDPGLLFSPRRLGTGFGVNLYWFVHPIRWWRMTRGTVLE